MFWTEREKVLSQAHQLQVFLEMCEQANSWLASKEAFLNNDDLGVGCTCMEKEDDLLYLTGHVSLHPFFLMFLSCSLCLFYYYDFLFFCSFFTFIGGEMSYLVEGCFMCFSHVSLLLYLMGGLSWYSQVVDSMLLMKHTVDIGKYIYYSIFTTDRNVITYLMLRGIFCQVVVCELLPDPPLLQYRSKILWNNQ